MADVAVHAAAWKACLLVSITPGKPLLAPVVQVVLLLSFVLSTPEQMAALLSRADINLVAKVKGLKRVAMSTAKRLKLLKKLLEKSFREHGDEGLATAPVCDPECEIQLRDVALDYVALAKDLAVVLESAEGIEGLEEIVQLSEELTDSSSDSTMGEQVLTNTEDKSAFHLLCSIVDGMLTTAEGLPGVLVFMMKVTLDGQLPPSSGGFRKIDTQREGKVTDEQKVYFATDRELKADGTYTSNQVPERLLYGHVIVTIPLVQQGRKEVNRPIGDPLDLFPVIMGIPKELERENFYQQLQQDIKGSNPTLLFLHGYNYSFNDSIKCAGQLAYDLSKIKGPRFSVVAYDWASCATIVKFQEKGGKAKWSYATDEGERVRDTLSNFVEFLKDLVGKVEEKDGELHIVAHSMGNFLLQRALKKLETEQVGNPEYKTTLGKLRTKVKSVTFAAPDVEEEGFKGMVEAMTVGDEKPHLTLLCSDSDRPLWFSSHFPIGSAGDDVQPTRNRKRRVGWFNWEWLVPGLMINRPLGNRVHGTHIAIHPVVRPPGDPKLAIVDASSQKHRHGHGYFAASERALRSIRSRMQGTTLEDSATAHKMRKVAEKHCKDCHRTPVWQFAP